MRVIIKTIRCRTPTFDIEPSDTVESLKAKIYDGEGYDVAQQRLMFDKKWLEDGKTLAEYNITDGTTIFLFFIIPKEEYPNSHKESLNDNKMVKLSDSV